MPSNGESNGLLSPVLDQRRGSRSIFKAHTILSLSHDRNHSVVYSVLNSQREFRTEYIEMWRKEHAWRRRALARFLKGS